jgi:hypothetical protein
MLDVRQSSTKNPILPIALMTVIKPATNNPFRAIGYQYRTQFSDEGSIGGKSEPMWLSSVILNKMEP